MMSLGIFVSQTVARQEGKELLDLCERSGVRSHLVVHDREAPPSEETLCGIGVALLSVDVIGKSTKTFLEPEIESFVDSLRAAHNLQWLQVPSAGMDRPFYAELRAKGVRLTSSAGANAKAVAHTAAAGVLALSRCIPDWVRAQREHRWHPLRGELIPAELEGQRAIVVGTGPIGQGIARILRALDLRVDGVSRTVKTLPHFDSVISFEALDDLLPQADWLVLACPLTDKTLRLVDARRLALMKASARLVNVARGEVIDEPPLIDALRSGQLAGAYLDVFATEPLPPDSPLWDFPQVLISAHSAGNSTGHQRNVVAQFKANLLRFIRAEPLTNEWQASQ